MGKGTLYVVATPLGNLEDITLRAIRVLKEVPLIACEDTRRTVKLLNRYGIRTPLFPFHEHNRARAGAVLLRRLAEGESVALVSDAGTPAISDPGYELVRDAVLAEVPVESVPGPSALVSALVVSGLPTARFAFEGFLPARGERRRKALSALQTEERTLVFYESPMRVGSLLAEAAEVLGERRACLVRELSKVHEEILRGTLRDLAAEIARRGGSVPGEVTLVVEGARKPVPSSVGEAVRAALEDSPVSSSRDLAREIAGRTGLPKKEVYAELIRRRGM